MGDIRKEEYFKKDTIIKEGENFLEQIFPFRKKSRLSPDMKRSALLILDMQEFFLNKESHAFIPSADAIIPNLIKLQKFFLKFKRPVIFTRHINSEKNSGQMGTWWRDILKEEDPLSALSKKFSLKDSLILKKTQYNAFYETELEEILKNYKTEQILIGGVMTHLCCETTAREAFVRGFDVFFGIDFTATYSRDFHKATLLNLAHGFAVPVLSSEFLNKKNINV
ncbi:MAG: isochorismatase family protein [Acidobacteriota bacterium]